MKEAALTELKANLKDLRLTAMNRELNTSLRQAAESGLGHDEFLVDLTRQEIESRAAGRLQRRIREARFPLIKPLETFNPAAASGLDLRVFRELISCDYIKQGRNVIFMGSSGTGKTHMASGLGLEACKKNYKTRFATCYGLVNELIEARQERDLQRLLARYRRYDLLILDELGYIPFSKEGAELLFQVLAERHEKGSVMITTNLGFADWTQVFDDQTMTAALLDRVTHKAEIINCSWQSYRLKQSLERRNNTAEERRDESRGPRPSRKTP